jgi:hypothetical protein
LRFEPRLLFVFVLLFATLLSATPSPRAQSSSSTITTVYVSPTSTCCISNTPYKPGQTFSVSVNVSLASGEYLSSFDVRVNYTNYHSSYVQGVLDALSVDYSSNLFSSYEARGQTVVPAECINGISVLTTASGCSSDTIGQVHLTEVLLGQAKLAGPLIGQLFRIIFNVTGYGSSAIVPDSANVVNPTPDPSNPQEINPQFIPTLTKGGVFGNKGVVAFFNFQPSDASVSPAVLPNNQVSFDASGSFVSYNISSHIETYSWSFGDGSGVENVTISSNVHTFAQTGNYNVSLIVWDSKNAQGVFSRVVPVVPALGGLALTVEDQSGTTINGGVQVGLFNTSASPTPYTTKTINALGGVTFSRLAPGNYYVTFSGQGFLDRSKTERVIPGLTTGDAIRLARTPSSPDYSALIYGGAILAALGIFSSAIIYQKRKSARRSGKVKARASNTKNRRV